MGDGVGRGIISRSFFPFFTAQSPYLISFLLHFNSGVLTAKYCGKKRAFPLLPSPCIATLGDWEPEVSQHEASNSTGLAGCSSRKSPRSSNAGRAEEFREAFRSAPSSCCRCDDSGAGGGLCAGGLVRGVPCRHAAEGETAVPGLAPCGRGNRGAPRQPGAVAGAVEVEPLSLAYLTGSLRG